MVRAGLVFVDVDTQVDFMSPQGALYVTGAQEIIKNLRRLTMYARQHAIPIIASADAHRHDDPEFHHFQFPPHCVKGTPGQRRIAETEITHAAMIGTAADPDAASKFEKAGAVVLEKVTFDLFDNPNAEHIVAAVPDTEFVVYGVATDYCVKATVLGLCNRGRRVTLVTDAIRSVNAQSGTAAIEEFRRRGVRFATTDEICRG